MANGPLGGFMPTPAAPAQPPSIKLDTTASSRGTFNNFLKSMNGATSLNPPSMAPMVGANPMMAPAANIDIFNQPVAMMQSGGDPMDASFSDFAGFSDSSDPFGGGDTSIDDVGSESESDPIDLSSDIIQAGTRDVPLNIFADDAQASVGTNVGLEKAGGFTAGVQKDVPGRFTAFRSPSFAMRGIARDFRSKINNSGDDGLTVSNYFNTFNPSDDNAERLKEFEELTGKKAGDTLNIGDMKNIMNVQAKYEAGIRNVPDSVQNAILSTVNIDDDRKVEDILGNLDLGRLDTKDPSRAIDVFENITPSTDRITQTAFRTTLPGANLPNVSSTRSTVPQDQARAIVNLVGGTPPLTEVEKGLQQNQQDLMAQRGRALGSITPDTALETMSGRVGPRDTVFDIDTRTDERSTVGDDFMPALDMVDARLDRLAKTDANVRDMDDIDRLTAGKSSDRLLPDEPPPIVAPGIGAPKEFRDPFPNAGIKIGSRTIPTIFSLANEFSKYSRGRVLDSIAQKGYTPVYDGDVIVGAKDKFGNLMEGMDPNAPMGGDDNQEPIIRKPIAPVVEEKKDDDKPPNIIGGTDPIVTLPVERPTVVASPFAPSSANISPVTFDTGQLNKLIEALTGVAARPVVAKQEGGLVSAVDEFLASGS
tara:strand:- start:10431 stop:12377 length:1947 start_codon:yes stop_codon:yes gene_type:complete